MATLEKAEALLEDLRAASWDAAVRDLAEVEVCPALPRLGVTQSAFCGWRQ